jgi:hypothetical protein
MVSIRTCVLHNGMFYGINKDLFFYKSVRYGVNKDLAFTKRHVLWDQ